MWCVIPDAVSYNCVADRCADGTVSAPLPMCWVASYACPLPPMVMNERLIRRWHSGRERILQTKTLAKNMSLTKNEPIMALRHRYYAQSHCWRWEWATVRMAVLWACGGWQHFKGDLVVPSLEFHDYCLSNQKNAPIVVKKEEERRQNRQNVMGLGESSWHSQKNQRTSLRFSQKCFTCPNISISQYHRRPIHHVLLSALFLDKDQPSKHWILLFRKKYQ